MAHQCQAMAHRELLGCVDKSVVPSDLKLEEPKLTHLSVMTPYLLLPNSLSHHAYGINDCRLLSHEVLKAHQFQVMTHFELLGYGVKSLLALPDLKLEPKLTHLSAMTPYLLLPSSFISCL
jgi:hypothetical protein